jgi:hypothetical protein
LERSSLKKILVVAESINVEDSSGSKANVALIKNLKSAGFDLMVYHYTRREIKLETIPCKAIKENRRSLLFYLSRIQRKIQHAFNCDLSRYLEPCFGFSFTFLNDTKSIAAALMSEKNFQPDLVFTLSKGASYRPHHALLQLPMFHDKWIAYIHDPYPFHYYPKPYTWSEPGYQMKIEFFREVAAKCKCAGYPSLLLATWMENHYPHFKGKRIIIPHQSSTKNDYPLTLPSWFDSKKFNLLHAGNLMKQRDPFPLIEGFLRFLDKNPAAEEEARLLLVGNASYHSANLKQYEVRIPQLFVSKGYMFYETVLQLQKAISVNVILESTAELSPFLPGKFPHCVTADKPILHLGPKKSEVHRLLGEEYEFHSEADDIEKISEKIENLYFNWKENNQNLILDKPNLKYYISADYLNEQIWNLL